MNPTKSIDYLFKGSHPAFYWAAFLLVKKGKSAIILDHEDFHSWNCFPTGILDQMGLSHLKTDRNLRPFQILTPQGRFAIYSDPKLTKMDIDFCTGGQLHPEIRRGMNFFLKGMDFPRVTDREWNESMDSFPQLEFVDLSSRQVKQEWLKVLLQSGVRIELQERDLPRAIHTVEFDFSSSRIFQTKKEIIVPMKTLPLGATPRMLYVETGTPLIEILHRDGQVKFRGIFNEFPGWMERLFQVVEPYFPKGFLDPSQARLNLLSNSFQEWVDTNKKGIRNSPGFWKVSPMHLADWGEKTPFLRLSQVLSQNHKKEQLFDSKELL